MRLLQIRGATGRNPSRFMRQVTVIGGGMAGAEAAALLSKLGIQTRLYEMKPKKFSEAHKLSTMGELVCSNSFGALAPFSAPGLLKYEMRLLRSIIMEAADVSKVPAGKALAVDRVLFSDWIDRELSLDENIEVIREECQSIPQEGYTIVATGPLTSDSLGEDLARYLGQDTLYFYDSISPIVSADSIDYSKTFFASRYQEDQDDYLNCPMDRTQYEKFVQEIIKAEKTPVKSFEALKCFEACLPIEVLASRGLETLAFGPMKPVGLLDPRTGRRPYAVVQLRRENQPTTMYNLVGFQTRMKWGEQKRIFQTIPGLENAEFIRFGSMHRNTYVDSPKVLNSDLSIKGHPHVHLSGQITGVEGYVESAAMGQWVALVVASKLLLGETLSPPPRESALGSLIHAISHGPLHGQFSPMNINFGLLPPLGHKKYLNKDDKRKAMIAQAHSKFGEWLTSTSRLLGYPFARDLPIHHAG